MENSSTLPTWETGHTKRLIHAGDLNPWLVILVIFTIFIAIFIMYTLYKYYSPTPPNLPRQLKLQPLRRLDNNIIESFVVEDFLPGIQQENHCSICCFDFEEGDRVVTLPSCNHRFHDGCIRKWFENQTNCPMCRFEFMAS
ncbi:RING-H2 finger protein ATL40-like [Impatiens glandulifera]|uniref:RING-H2 finger protein ATL40-like n=1 Tax=Impatiens glandulifera TaxID=253017 RepID=UPI001FB1A00B|nr:RING-H2 finger protein ATL40-like [Impatiens glandulifera]